MGVRGFPIKALGNDEVLETPWNGGVLEPLVSGGVFESLGLEPLT